MINHNRLLQINHLTTENITRRKKRL